MSKLSEKLRNLSDGVISASMAPDSYSEIRAEMCGGMERAYKLNKETVLEDLEEVKMLIKRDSDTLFLIENKLKEGFIAFDRGDKELGQKIMLEVYGMDLVKLR